MKNDFDSYTLYAYTPFIRYTVRIRVELDHCIDGTVLEEAANKAFVRFPYFSRKVTRDSEGGYVLVPNDQPISVKPEGDKAPVLGGAESNRHLVSINYDGPVIYFNFSHSICGACGAMFWIKATLWQYLTDKTGDQISSEGIKLPGTPIEDGEIKSPVTEELIKDDPIGVYNRGSGYVPVGEYAGFFANPFAKDQVFFPIAIDQSCLIKYARSNDGSPNSILSAAMFKAVGRVWQKRSGCKQITSGIVDNYRAHVGCPDTYRDIIRLLHACYKPSMLDWPIDKLSTVTRASMYIQMEPDVSCAEYRNVLAYRDGIDKKKSNLTKRLYALNNNPLTHGTVDSYVISYVGRIDWAGLAKYIKSVQTISDGHMIIEVNAANDKVFVSFQQVNPKRSYLDSFLAVLDEEHITYSVGAMQYKRLPGLILNGR